MIQVIYETQGTMLIVRPEGRLDTLTSPELEKEVRSRLDGIENVKLDLQSVEYVSSGGIRMMLAIEKLLQKRGGRLKVSHVGEYIMEVFDMVGFTDVVEILQE